MNIIFAKYTEYVYLQLKRYFMQCESVFIYHVAFIYVRINQFIIEKIVKKTERAPNIIN